jgi:methylenetetrahydrofolate reductase (NADPH)
MRDTIETGPTVRALVAKARIEVIPVRGADEKVSAIPRDTTITITCSAKFGLERTLEHTERAVKAGHHVVPHIAARQVTGRSQLAGMISRLDGIGVTNLFVVGGDAAEPAGPYASSAQLLEDLAALDHGIRDIGVGCYPEGHPVVPADRLTEALLLKQETATYMVSQLCFDRDALVGWLRTARGAGVRLPLHIGIAAPMNTLKLTELSLKIGVGTSVRFLTKQHGLVGSLLRGNSYRPEDLLTAMGGALTDPALAIAGIHVFSFNQIPSTLEWRQRLLGD